MSKILDFFKKLFSFNKDVKMLNEGKKRETIKAVIPNEYEKIEEMIYAEELVLEELEDSQLEKISKILDKQIFFEKKRISELSKNLNSMKGEIIKNI